MLGATSAAAQALPPLLDGERIDARWRVATLPAQKPPVTRFEPAPVDGRTALRVVVDGSYGNLVLDTPGRPAPRRVGWRWRVDQPNAQADLRRKGGDDSAIKLCLSFDLPLDQVPFVERQLLRMARATSGQDLPAATLCWAFGHDEPVDQVIENPFSRRVRTLVLRGRADGNGRWLAESRDVAADWRRAFGDEAPRPPPLLALGVAGDGDNTGARSLAWLADLQVDE
ncbi:MAG: DUF3047 domain-containing protein [Rubrivivax sp.]